MSDPKTLIIAEAGVNHNGDMNMARRLIDVAADASELALEKIKTVEGTIRARVLY